MDQLRGRNLSHIGCTLGLTLGLIVGMFGAIEVLQATTGGVNGAVAALAVATIGLGALGYHLGGLLTRRLWGGKREADALAPRNGSENPIDGRGHPPAR